MQSVKSVYIVGISGIGMSAVAKILHQKGVEVSGSADKENEQTKILRALGIDVKIPHKKENVPAMKLVLYSTAIKQDHVELEAARALGLEVYSRKEFFPFFFGSLFQETKKIAVSGTHGKTTTTTMIAKVFLEGGLASNFLVGAMWDEMGSNERVVKDAEFFVVEADESDGSFLGIPSFVSVVNNIDRDHLDFYGDKETLKEAYLQFVHKTDKEGCIFLGESASCLKENLERDFVIYGFSKEAELQAYDLKTESNGQTFKARFRNEELGSFKLPVLGRHFVSNALASIGIGLFFKVPLEAIKKALENYRLPSRRMELKGAFRGIPVIDDYAHHPLALMKTYEALKVKYDKMAILFQPHRYSRTKEVEEELIDVFKTIRDEGSSVILLPIYSAGEEPIEGISSETIAQKAGAFYVRDFEQAKEIVVSNEGVKAIVSAGAGDVTYFYSFLAEEEIYGKND